MPRRDLPAEPKGSEITSEEHYLRRREFMKQAGLFVATSAAWGGGLLALSSRGEADPPKPPPKVPTGSGSAGLVVATRGEWTVNEAQTPYASVTTYNNYYELGTSKSDPAGAAHSLRPRPWTVRVEGEVEKPLTLDI